jgi:hypothetical protein
LGNNDLTEDVMRQLLPVLMRELTYAAREGVKWTLISLVLLVCMWFLTDGLPHVAAMINGLTSDHVLQPGATQLDTPHHLANSR